MERPGNADRGIPTALVPPPFFLGSDFLAAPVVLSQHHVCRREVTPWATRVRLLKNRR